MTKFKRLLTAMSASTMAMIATPVVAAPINLDFSGTVGSNKDPFSGTLDLDVTNGMATSGTGTLSIYGADKLDLVLITTSTSYNETNPGPVGFRSNGGTDIGGADQAYPYNNGLLFDVGTKTASFDAYPLFAISDNFALFTGVLDGVKHYDQVGTATTTPSAVPEPATWAMMLIGFGALGLAMRRRKPQQDAAFA